LKGFEFKKRIGSFASKKSRNTADKLAPINDVESLLHVCAATKKQRKITANRFSCALSEADAFPESAKSA
jgi:hypothetical protein